MTTPMIQSDSSPATQTSHSPSDQIERSPRRSDRLALAFLSACCVLAVPLLFAVNLPQGLLTIAVAALLAAFVIRGLLTRSWLPHTAVDWPNVLLLLLLPLGLWASTDQSVSWPVIYKVIAGFALFYGLAGLAGSRWTRALPWLLLLASLGLAAVVLLGTNWATAKLAWLPDTLYDLLPTLRLPWRTQGIHPNLSGGAMAWLLLPAIALLLWSGDRRMQGLAAATALLTALALLLSQSRGAWLGVALALLVMPLLRYRRWWIVVLAAAALAAVAALALGPDGLQNLLFPQPAGEEIGATINTLPSRLDLWLRTLTMLQDFGLAGAGPGQFEQMVMVLYPPFFTGLLGGFQHAHNLYLQAAVDFGVLGLVALVALILGSGASMVAATRPKSTHLADRPLTALVIGLFGSLLAFAVHGMVDAVLVAPRGYALLFALLGLAAAASSQLCTGRAERSEA